MPDSLYEHDVLEWAEQQSDLLRRLARGERVNDAIDWPNVIEELQDVGLSELHACQGLLRQALIHLLKLRLEPDSTAKAHWGGEVIGFLADGEARFTPSMRQRIDLQKQWRWALRRAATERDDLPIALPDRCPFSLDDLLTENADPKALAARIG